MVFFHTEENEYSTDKVIQYFLYHGGKEYCRHDDANPVDYFSLEMDSTDDHVNFSASGENYDINPEVKIFYRRGDIVFNNNFVKLDYGQKNVQQFVTNELKSLRNYSSLSMHTRAGGFGSFFEELATNKLQQLQEARRAGFAIPATLVTNNKEKLLAFQAAKGKLIFKPITNHHTIKNDNIFISPQGTQLVSNEFLDQLAETFFPTLFQETVAKEIEIRAFFFNGQFYSAAIFSQKNEKTSLDFRNYDFEEANRVVPFQLPVAVEAKLRKAYDGLGLTTGSADLILTPQGEYVFLEINALGQFAWISEACNFNIEQKMAKYLCRQIN